VDPRNADVVYAGLWDAPYHDECTGDGIVMTRDGGKTWTSINGTGLTCKRVARIVVDPHEPNRLYLGTTGNGVFVGRVSNP
jgi:proline racemase